MMEAIVDVNDTQTGNTDKTSQPLAGAMAVAAGFLRLVPHPYNMEGINALGLFAGARLRSWKAYAVPLAVMVVTDALLKIPLARMGYPTVNWATPFVYASFLFNVWLGRLLLRDHGSPVRLVAVSLLASAQFFLVSNFGVWAAGDGGFYPKTAEGLLACYVAAIPFFGTQAPPLGFFGNMLLGDLLCCGLLFGLDAVLRRNVFSRREPVLDR
jgi:hypothetical protein